MRSPIDLVTGASWRSGVVQFACFAALFATYDLKILARQRNAPHGVSLVNYIVRDGRTDESAMYMPTVRECVDGDWSSTDPYLKDHRDAPDIRPRLPAWIGAACYRLAEATIADARINGIAIGGPTNAAVLLLHVFPPALGAVLLVRIFARLVDRRTAFVLALLAVGGICYQPNYYVNLLRLSHFGGPASYNPELHLFRPYSLHLEVNRYFSPGITFGVFLLGLWLLAVDPELKRRRTAFLTGAGIALQLEAYPHAALVLSTIAGCLLIFATADRRREVGAVKATGELAVRAVAMLAALAVVAAPWVWRYFAFRRLPEAADIVQRIGIFDGRVDTQRTPILVWLVVALLLRRAAHRARQGRSSDTDFTGADRLWAAMMFATAGTVWIPGLLGHAGLFPQPWLIPLRCLSFLVPVLVGYPAMLWFRAATPRWAISPWSRRSALAAILAYAALLFHGEYAAGRNNAHLYAITPEMARFRVAVLGHTPPESAVLSDDLRLVSLLVCETDRYAAIGYGASSNASTNELLERLMIPCVLQGMPFERFYADYYLAGRGLPDGPSGAHWALHHGGDVQPVAPERLRAMYERLSQLAARDLAALYPFDYLYLDPARLDARYRPFFAATPDPWLWRRNVGEPSTTSPVAPNVDAGNR